MNKFFKKIVPQSDLGQLYVGTVAVFAILGAVSGVADAVLSRVLND